LRLTFVEDVGLLSMLRRPSAANVAYFLNGLRARASAYGHALLFTFNRRGDSVATFRALLARDARMAS
jgi:hypothetical protein